MPTRLLRSPAPLASLVSLAVASCGLVRYEARPIDVDAILEDIQESRRRTTVSVAAEPLTLSTLEALVVERDPEIREQVAAFRASLALDEVRARLRDPSFGLGVNGAIGPQIDRRRLAPAGNLTVSVPLSRRRSREDARDHAQVELEAARVAVAVRGALLDARSAYLEAAMAVERQAARADIADTVRAMAVTAEALARSGAASSLDLALLRLEAARAEQALFNAQMDRDAAVAGLARVVLIDPRELDGTALASGPIEWLGDPLLLERWDLQATRTDLAAIRHEHALAEAQLALEIALQVQDLGIGGSIAPELTESFTILGLVLSGALPIFRRNAQAIALAGAQRTAVEARYGIALDRARSDLQQALAAVDRATRRAAFLENETLPITEEVIDTADRAVRAGTASGLALLSATRTRAEVRFQEITARQAVLRAWMAVERAIEAPLLAGGSESVDDWPQPAEIVRWRDEHSEQ